MEARNVSEHIKLIESLINNTNANDQRRLNQELQRIKDKYEEIKHELDFLEKEALQNKVNESNQQTITYSKIDQQKYKSYVLQIALPTSEKANALFKRMQEEWKLPVKMFQDKIILIEPSNGPGTCGVFSRLVDTGGLIEAGKIEIVIAFKNTIQRNQFVTEIGLTGNLTSICIPLSGPCSSSIYFDKNALTKSPLPQPSLLQTRFNQFAPVNTHTPGSKSVENKIANRFQKLN